MNYHQLEKKENVSKWKALFFAFFIHFALLGGLYYVNAEDPTAIIPDFVLELFDNGSKNVAVAKSKAP